MRKLWLTFTVMLAFLVTAFAAPIVAKAQIMTTHRTVVHHRVKSGKKRTMRHRRKSVRRHRTRTMHHTPAPPVIR